MIVRGGVVSAQANRRGQLSGPLAKQLIKSGEACLGALHHPKVH